jgi:hypothetical protein
MHARTRSVFALALFAGLPAIAGDFSYAPFGGDGETFISPSFTYTAIADFNGVAGRNVNGVVFNDTGNSGTGYSLATATTPFGGFGNTATGTSNALLSDFFYTGDGSGNATMTLTGLTIGQRYVSSWYSASFDGGNRLVDLTPSDTGVPYRFNENYSGTGNGNILRYAFTATAATQTFSFDAVSNGDSFHHYAFTNAVENKSLLATPVISASTGAGPGFSPFTPRNNDLLQTNLASVTSSGNFTQEGSGGISILNNGLFVINGGNPGDNSQLATGANGTFVEFNLNIGVNTLGYDVSSIETYGGWNDGGRDHQLFRISYSLVGNSAFTPIGVLDYEPAGTGTPSAVRAIFATTLTGVDAIRLDFLPGQENGYVGYGEVDVVGTATVPEPATVMLAFLGGATLLTRRRR